MKTFFFDVETTGLDYTKHGIVQLSGLIEIDGEIKDVFNFYTQPPKGTEVMKDALKVNGLTIDQIRTFPSYQETWDRVTAILEKHVDKFDPSDKFYPAGYNVSFDYPFLQRMATIAGEEYFGSWFNHRLIDPFYLIRFLDYTGKLRLINHKLETVCNHFQIPITAHDALSDIKATCALTNLLLKTYVLPVSYEANKVEKE